MVKNLQDKIDIIFDGQQVSDFGFDLELDFKGYLVVILRFYKREFPFLT